MVPKPLAFLLTSLFLARSLAAAIPMPAELSEALKTFRAEGTRGWSFVQSTTGADKSLIEHFDPAKPEFHRWTLLKKDGREPTADEIKSYNELQTRRTRGDTAPNVKEQIDRDTCEPVAETPERGAWKFRLKPTDKEDSSAAHMTATFTLHRPTGTIERVELASFEPFKPLIGVNIEQARTTIEYSLPEGDRPTFLKKITVQLRGRAWWFKSLDQDLTVTYSDFAYAGKR